MFNRNAPMVQPSGSTSTTNTTGSNMSTTTGSSCISNGPSSLERVHFFARQLLTPDDLIQEQEYSRAKMRRHNRMLHGWGVVCGCEVIAARADWSVTIKPGYVLGPQGDEIIIDDCVTIDLSSQGVDGNARTGCGDDSDPWCSSVKTVRKTGDKVYLAVAYTECYSRPVRVQSTGCGCDDSQCEYSRIRDSFMVRVFDKLPTSYQSMKPSPQDPIQCPPEGIQECPDCPSDPWVVLAQITIKGKTIAQADIDNRTYRRNAISFANYWYMCPPERKIDVAHLKVSRVALYENEAPQAAPLIEMSETKLPWTATGATPWQLEAPSFALTVIEVAFTGLTLDANTVQDGVTFKVQNSQGNVALGTIQPMPAINGFRWILRSEQRGLQRGPYKVTLVGSSPEKSILSTTQLRLDGKTTDKLPSGDNSEGGDFVFTILVIPLG